MPFKLTSAGETLTLQAPDGTVIDTVTFGQQYDNISQGRATDGSGTLVYLSAPTPGTANSGAPPLPGFTFTKSNATVTFTLSVVPNFRYHLESGRPERRALAPARNRGYRHGSDADF